MLTGIGVSVLRAYTTVFFLASGASLAFGPPGWRVSPSYVVIGAWMPLRAWGVVLLAVGAAHVAALAWRQARTPVGAVAAHFVGATIAVVWAVSLCDTALVRRQPGVIGALLWGLLTVVEFALGESLLRRGR